jgi:hypothetical protein
MCACFKVWTVSGELLQSFDVHATFLSILKTLKKNKELTNRILETLKENKDFTSSTPLYHEIRLLCDDVVLCEENFAEAISHSGTDIQAVIVPSIDMAFDAFMRVTTSEELWRNHSLELFQSLDSAWPILFDHFSDLNTDHYYKLKMRLFEESEKFSVDQEQTWHTLTVVCGTLLSLCEDEKLVFERFRAWNFYCLVLGRFGDEEDAEALFHLSRVNFVGCQPALVSRFCEATMAAREEIASRPSDNRIKPSYYNYVRRLLPRTFTFPGSVIVKITQYINYVYNDGARATRPVELKLPHLEPR